MNLKTWRKFNGITQKQLANMLDVTDVTICRYETGARKNISDQIMQKIIKITNRQVMPNDFYGLSDVAES